MEKEPVKQHPGFEYTDPEGKVALIPVQQPEFYNLEEEAAWHQEHLALQTVIQENGADWTKDSILDAIEQGHVDAFRMNSFRFPPTFEGEWITTFTALYFDNREFGDRIANTVLTGFNRDQRQQ